MVAIKLNRYAWIESGIASKERVAIPVMTHPGIELLGKKVIEAVKDGNVHADAILAVNEKYPSQASTVIMDLTVEAEAFGADIEFGENEIPSVIGRLLNNSEEIEKLRVPEVDAARVPEYLKANRIVAEKINDKPVFAGCIGPYSLAGRLYDMTEIMMLIYTEPEAAKKLLQKCSDFLLKYCRALKECGVDGILMAEPAAGLLSNEDSQEFSSEFIKPIIDELQDETLVFALHNCGNMGHCTPAMVHTGAKMYHFGNKIDMGEALKETPPDCIALGNVDPVASFKQGTPEEMYKTTTDLLESTAEFPNFVLSSGCDTPPESSFENIDAFYRALEDFNARK